MERRRAIRLGAWIGLPVILVVLVALVWRWDWFIPLVESRASAALGRQVTIAHLHVSPGFRSDITLTDVTLANPPGWEGEPLAHIDRLAVAVNVWDYIRQGVLVIPRIEIGHPVVNLVQRADGQTNYALSIATGGNPSEGTTKIGDLRISDGAINAKLALLKADFVVNAGTQGDGQDAKIIAEANGTYGGAPITARATGGALLSLREASRPWPIDLQLQNAGTRVSLAGTLDDPLRLAGAALKLQVTGQDMNQLERFTGVPIPRTPPFRVASQVDFVEKRIRLTDFQGQVGSSDLAGGIDVDFGKERMDVRADLRSRQVNLTDFGGVIGAEPSRGPAPGQAPAKATNARRDRLLPDTPVSVPQLKWADIHLRYQGQHITGRSMPLDNVLVRVDVVDGNISIQPLNFGVGTGVIKAKVSLTPESNALRAKADVEFQQVDVARLMAATQVFKGAGTISGTAVFEARGNSTATMLANGDGALRLGMSGGNLSSLLVNLSGLQFGNALISALGLPERAQVECFIGDVGLRQGALSIRALVLDTEEGIVNGTGGANLKNETLDVHLRTEAKHFSIGSLPTPINVGGTLKSPTITPGAEVAIRGGLAAGLGVIFPPLAALPTIQFGTGDDNRCERLLAGARQQAGGDRLPAPKPSQQQR